MIIKHTRAGNEKVFLQLKFKAKIYYVDFPTSSHRKQCINLTYNILKDNIGRLIQSNFEFNINLKQSFKNN